MNGYCAEHRERERLVCELYRLYWSERRIAAMGRGAFDALG